MSLSHGGSIQDNLDLSAIQKSIKRGRKRKSLIICCFPAESINEITGNEGIKLQRDIYTQQTTIIITKAGIIESGVSSPIHPTRLHLRWRTITNGHSELVNWRLLLLVEELPTDPSTLVSSIHCRCSRTRPRGVRNTSCFGAVHMLGLWWLVMAMYHVVLIENGELTVAEFQRELTRAYDYSMPGNLTFMIHTHCLSLLDYEV